MGLRSDPPRMASELPLLAMNAAPIGLTLLLFGLFAWWDRRKPPERRDAWGPWGVLLPASALGLGAYLFPLVMTLLLGPPDLSIFAIMHLAILVGGTLFFALCIAWSLRGHERRVGAGLGRPRLPVTKVRQ